MHIPIQIYILKLAGNEPISSWNIIGKKKGVKRKNKKI